MLVTGDVSEFRPGAGQLTLPSSRTRSRSPPRARRDDRAGPGRPGRPLAAHRRSSRTTRRRRRGPADNVRPAAGRHRLPREPRGHARADRRPRGGRPDATASARSPTVAAAGFGGPSTAARRHLRHARGLQPRAADPRRRARADVPDVNRRRLRRATVDASSTTRSATSSTTRRATPTRIDRGLQREVTDAPQRATQLAVASINVENLDPADPPAKFDAARLDRRRQPPQPGHPGRRGGPGQRRRRRDGAVDRRRRHAAREFIAAIAGGGRPDVRVPPDRPGATTRTAASRAATSASASCSAPIAASSSSTGRAATSTTPTGVIAHEAGRAAAVQPGPHRPDQPGVQQQPQAAGRRVPLEGPDRVRDREPLQLQGRRRPAVRPPPAAGAVLGGPAPPAGGGARRLRRAHPRGRPARRTSSCSATSTTSSSRRRSRSWRATGSDQPDGDAAGERALLLRVRRQLAGARPDPGQPNELLTPTPEYDSVHVNAEFTDQASDHDPQVARVVVRGTGNASSRP